MDSKKKKERREFLKKSGLITLGTLGVYSVSNSLLSSVLSFPASNSSRFFQNNKFILVPLPYAYDGLEPYIDKATMEIHYQRHHATYVVNLNKAIEGLTIPYDFEELMGSISKYPAVMRNNGGGHYNHTLFWGLMAANAGGKPAGRLADAMNKVFGSFDNLKIKFTETAMKHFGSGWAWLVLNNGKLEIGTTANQDNPVMDVSAFRGKPILCLDIWEHAYYLKYENRRKEYIEAWWNVVNWEEAERLYNAAAPEK